MNIRPVKKTDIEALIQLCSEHAAFERATFDPYGKAELLSKYLFGADKSLKCIVVEDHNELVGYATIMKQFSTWDASYYFYLDCLFLKESVRGLGVGYKLMDRVKEYAQAENCQIVQWQTPDFNKNAIEFYKRIGATSKTKERFFWEI